MLADDAATDLRTDTRRSPDDGSRHEWSEWFNAFPHQPRSPDATFRRSDRAPESARPARCHLRVVAKRRHRSGPRRVVPSGGQVMSDHIRSVLLGYIRADLLRNGTELPRMASVLNALATTEKF